MSEAPNLSNQPLGEALILWCDKDRLAAVIEAQAFFLEEELRDRKRLPLGGASVLAATRRNRTADQERYAYRQLDIAWDILIEDFQRRIQAGEIYISGIQTRPKRQENRNLIPNGWAADFEFDFFLDIVSISYRYRYVSVTASTSPPPPVTIVDPPPRTAITVSRETVSSLDDEQILFLLEAHADRVIRNDTRMITPHKVSVVPIIRGKMQYRAKNGELEARMSDEMNWLAKWIALRIPHYQTPTPKSLANALRGDYKDCQAQSKGMMA